MLVAVAAPARAQLCAGRSSFNRAPIQLGLAAGVTTDGFLLGGSVGLGTDRLFGTVTFGNEPPDRSGDARGWIGASVGASQPLRLDNRLHLCPMAGVAWAPGARASAGTPRARFSAGVIVGVLATNGTRAAIVPTLAFNVHQDRGATSARTVATVGAGVGLVWTNGVAVVPAAAIPIENSRETASVAVRVSVPLPLR